MYNLDNFDTDSLKQYTNNNPTDPNQIDLTPSQNNYSNIDYKNEVDS